MRCITLIEINIGQFKKNAGEIVTIAREAEMAPVGFGEEQIVFQNPVQLNLTLTNTKGTISLEGKAKATLMLVCDKCLDTFYMPLETELSEIYYHEGQIQGEPDEDWIPYKGDVLDIGPEVEKAFLISLPMRVICGENCKGLCPVCGNHKLRQPCQCEEETGDPRLTILKDLLPK